MCDQPVMSAAAETNSGPEKKTQKNKTAILWLVARQWG